MPSFAFPSSATRWLLPLALLVAGLATSAVAEAGGPYYPGALGFDISFPQCGAVNQTGAFGIVGVTGGKSFTTNSCFAAEYDYVAQKTGLVSIYMNLNAPVGKTAKPNTSSPTPCGAGDQECQAHNYGWNAAAYTFGITGPIGVPGSRNAETWWLDIEIANSWAGKSSINRATIDGARDYLLAHGVTNVGVYSTPGMWSQITGGWQDGTLKVWYAGTSSTSCDQVKSFTSGPVWLLQNASGVSNGDRGC